MVVHQLRLTLVVEVHTILDSGGRGTHYTWNWLWKCARHLTLMAVGIHTKPVTRGGSVHDNKHGDWNIPYTWHWWWKCPLHLTLVEEVYTTPDTGGGGAEPELYEEGGGAGRVEGEGGVDAQRLLFTGSILSPAWPSNICHWKRKCRTRFLGPYLPAWLGLTH